MSKVSTVEIIKPPMTTVANGRCTSAPAEVAIAIGTNPKDATSPVRNTGRSKCGVPLFDNLVCSHGIGILFTKFVEVIYHQDTIQYCYPEQSNESYSGRYAKREPA